MERLGDDVLSLILSYVYDPNDRKSFSQVSKQWLRVEGSNRLSLRLFEPNLIPNFLSRFPNLLKFESPKVITNSQIQFIATTCPKIEFLNLNYKEIRNRFDEFDDITGLDDVDDHGICEIAKGCCNLKNVFLRRRSQIGNFGVISLVNSARNLTNLDLGRCNRIVDESLKAIADLKSLKILNLQACWLITDIGLALLANGSVSKTLQKLLISECDRITDTGLLHLRDMLCLEELNLGDCGPKVTDIGGVSLASIRTLKRLDLSWLINISNVTIIALAQRCKNLVGVDFKGCESISGEGVRAFASHESLEVLVLTSCRNLAIEDVEETVFGCESLRYIALDKGLRKWFPLDMQETISLICQIDWT